MRMIFTAKAAKLAKVKIMSIQLAYKATLKCDLRSAYVLGCQPDRHGKE